ncbi:MAG: hypothetical protein RML94_07970 [Bacteroidia bacterium]|nr:hypothetical protein [Bacteroidia bacterium]
MGVSLAALGSGYCALRYRFGASLRYALPNGMLRIPHASCILMFCFFYTYPYFTLFDLDYQMLTRLNFFTLFEICTFYLVLHSFSNIYKVKP